MHIQNNNFGYLKINIISDIKNSYFGYPKSEINISDIQNNYSR